MTATQPIKPTTSIVREADRPVALVVDDDPDTRQDIAVVLERDGWSVRQARDGEQALLLAREHVPEVILLDIALPTISGFEVLQILKSWTDQPTRVVIVSAYATFVQLGHLRLADAAVQKPLAADVLVEVVNRTARRLVS